PGAEVEGPRPRPVPGRSSRPPLLPLPPSRPGRYPAHPHPDGVDLGGRVRDLPPRRLARHESLGPDHGGGRPLRDPPHRPGGPPPSTRPAWRRTSATHGCRSSTPSSGRVSPSRRPRASGERRSCRCRSSTPRSRSRRRRPRRLAVSVGTAFYPRTAPLNRKLQWREWSGYLAASAYHDSHEIEYNAIREAAALIDVSPLYKYLVSGPDSTRLVDRVITRDAEKVAIGRVYYTS